MHAYTQFYFILLILYVLVIAILYFCVYFSIEIVFCFLILANIKILNFNDIYVILKITWIKNFCKSYCNILCENNKHKHYLYVIRVTTNLNKILKLMLSSQ